MSKELVNLKSFIHNFVFDNDDPPSFTQYKLIIAKYNQLRTDEKEKLHNIFSNLPKELYFNSMYWRCLVYKAVSLSPICTECELRKSETLLMDKKYPIFTDHEHFQNGKVLCWHCYRKLN